MCHCVNLGMQAGRESVGATVVERVAAMWFGVRGYSVEQKLRVDASITVRKQNVKMSFVKPCAHRVWCILAYIGNDSTLLLSTLLLSIRGKGVPLRFRTCGTPDDRGPITLLQARTDGELQ